MRHHDRARQPLRQEAARARHPHLHHRDELRGAVARGQDGAGQGRLDGGLRDLLWRGGNDPAGAGSLDQVVLPGDSEPLRLQPPSPDAGRRDRVLHRPGLQGRRGRPPDGPEGDRAGRRDAQPAGRDRPAVAGAPSGLARARRPIAEGAGDPRGHQLRGPDPAQAGRGARLRRRPDGRQVRPRRHLPGRGRRRHRRGAAYRRRGDRHPAAGRHSRGAPGARGRRALRRGRPRGRRRDSQRRRRRQMPGARVPTPSRSATPP